MKYSLRTILFLTGLVCAWLAALATHSPLLLELASLSTLLVLFLAVPLYFFDQPDRRPFWVGFAAGGLGLLIASKLFPLPVSETHRLLIELMTSPVDDPLSFRPGAIELGKAMRYLITFVFALLGGFATSFMANNPEKEIAG